MVRKRDLVKQRGYSRTFYRNHSAQVVHEVAARRDRIREFITRQKAFGCVQCGYKRCVGALEFHHLSTDKELSIGKALARGWGEKRILDEIAKCELLCANCHRERHVCGRNSNR